MSVKKVLVRGGLIAVVSVVVFDQFIAPSMAANLASGFEQMEADNRMAENISNAEVASVTNDPLPASEATTPAIASGPIKLSDLDESDRAIRRAINVSGHLCAKPIEVVPTGSPGLYGVQCITNRDGSGRSTYLVNSRTNDVTEI